MPIDRQAAMKAALAKKTQESYEKREDSGQFKSIFMDNPDLIFWKVSAAQHMVDILPYMAGINDPGAKKGEWTYVFVVWVHYGVGVNQDAYVCPARNYGLPCPICEYREEIRKQDDYDEDLVRELTPKRRSIYWIICYDSPKEEEKGPQIFDVAHWFMEKYLVTLAKTPERSGQKAVQPYIPFSDIDEGKTIVFEKKGQKRNTEYVGHKFMDRNYTIPFELVERLPALDSLIEIHTYEEIKAAFYGGADELAPPPVEEAPAPAPPPVETPAPTPLVRRTIAPPPAATPAPAPAAAPRPAVRQPSQVATNQCPAGGNFGQDCEQLEACNGCPQWDPCSQLADKIAAEAAGAAPPPPPAPPVRVPRAAPPQPSPAAGPTPAPRPIPRPPAVPTPAAGASPTPAGPRRIARR